MKVKPLLLAVYIVSLAMFPCADSETCQDEIRTGIVAANNFDHTHSDAEQDVCTPFCICSCCSAHVRLLSLAAFESRSFHNNSKLNSHYMGSPDLKVSHSIWQPPRAEV